MPGATEEVEPAARDARCAYQDLDGAERIEEADGLLAVCHQHEIDQLDGIFWIQRLSRPKQERLVSRAGSRAAARRLRGHSRLQCSCFVLVSTHAAGPGLLST